MARAMAKFSRASAIAGHRLRKLAAGMSVFQSIDNQVLLLYIPATTPTEAGHLVTWNYLTEELQHVSDLPNDLVISVATNVLGD